MLFSKISKSLLTVEELSLKPSSSISIPKRKIATPAAISWKSRLAQKPTLRINRMTGSRSFFIKEFITG